MKYAAVNILLGLGFALQGYLAPHLAVGLLWLAGCFFALGLAHLRNAPKLFGKRPTGAIAWWSWIAFLPLHLCLHAIWQLSRLFSREHPSDVVAPHLTVGRRLLASEIPADIAIIVDLTCEFPEPVAIRTKKDYRLFPILDASIPAIEDLRKFIANLPARPIYVHCAQGHGRTGLFTIAYLVERNICPNSEEAAERLRRCRPGIVLNAQQQAFVKTHYGPAIPDATGTAARVRPAPPPP